MSKISLKLCTFSPWISFKLVEFRLRKNVWTLWFISGKDRELESQKAGESQGTLSKKIGWKSWRSVTQFWRILKGESLFSKSKLKNLKNLKVAGGAGEGGRGQEEVQTPTHCLGIIWYSPYSSKNAGSALHILHQAIKIRVI